MATCGVRFEMNADTKLGDLFRLQLHKFEDEVKSIVDRAAKEQGMEKTLRELNITWADLQYDIEIHNRTKIELVKLSDELVETLEENQMQIQGLLASKYVDFFREQVTSWQKKLAAADQVSSLFRYRIFPAMSILVIFYVQYWLNNFYLSCKMVYLFLVIL